MYNPSEMAAPILFPHEFGTRIKRYGHDHRLFSLSRPVFPGTRCLQLAFGIPDPCKKDGCLNRMKDVPSSADPDGHESMPVHLRSDVTDGDLHHDCSHTGVKKITVPDVLFRHAHPAQNMDTLPKYHVPKCFETNSSGGTPLENSCSTIRTNNTVPPHCLITGVGRSPFSSNTCTS